MNSPEEAGYSTRVTHRKLETYIYNARTDTSNYTVARTETSNYDVASDGQSHCTKLKTKDYLRLVINEYISIVFVISSFLNYFAILCD